jgi:hypothetical protein
MPPRVVLFIIASAMKLTAIRGIKYCIAVVLLLLKFTLLSCNI